MNPIVSVIIPVYNVERYLRQCIDSVISQTFADIEIILVDDESPDSSPAICDEYASQYPNISVIHKHNEGLGLTRNVGIEAARGKYVFFLDSDDYIRHDALERLIDTATRNNAQIVHGRLNDFVIPGQFSHSVTGGQDLVITGKENLRHTALCTFSQPMGKADNPFSVDGSSCGALYDREFLKQNNIHFLSERQYISEDYLFNYECALRADSIVQIPDTIYHYRVNLESLTKSPSAGRLQRIADFCTYIEKRFQDDGFGIESRAYAVGYALSGIRAQYKFIFLSNWPYRKKMEWADKSGDIPYLNDMATIVMELPLSRLHRLGYTLYHKHKWSLLFALIKLQSYARRLKRSNF